MERENKDTPDIRIGTSGWQHPQWRGAFYPASLPRHRWLEHYAARLDCVELEESFYQVPEPLVVAEWDAAVPAGFRFTLRAPHTITHRKKLKNCDDLVRRFLDRAALLEARLGAVVFELPARWRRNTHRLAGFLRRLPADYPFVFAFGDSSWYCEEVFALLAERGVAICFTQADAESSPPLTAPDLVYARLAESTPPESAGYAFPSLRSWAGRARGWQREGRTVYVIFDRAGGGAALRSAQRMRLLLAEDTIGPGGASPTPRSGAMHTTPPGAPPARPGDEA